MKPIRKISEAARNIAKGDFSMRVAPRRKGGRKDFFDVLNEYSLMESHIIYFSVGESKIKVILIKKDPTFSV
jgi:hypothetical protein